MYKLKALSKPGMYQIHSADYGAFEGDFKSIKKKAAQIGIITSEFEIAVEEMAMNEHNVAEFGLRGRFIFSKTEKM